MQIPEVIQQTPLQFIFIHDIIIKSDSLNRIEPERKQEQGFSCIETVVVIQSNQQ